MANEEVTTLALGVDSSQVRTAGEDLDRLTKASERTATGVEAMLGKLDELASAANKAAAAKRKASDSSKDLERAMLDASLKAQLLGDGIGWAINQAAALAKGMFALSLELGNYQDIADVTMADPAGLASLRTAADVANVSMSAVAGTIQQMQLRLSRGDNDSNKGAAAALKAIGLEIETLRAMRGDEQLRVLAEALNKYEDSGSKVAVMQTAAGRGSAQLLGMMKELSGETERGIVITAEQIRMADDLGDSMSRNASQTRQLLQVMGIPLLEAMSAASSAINTVAKELLGVGSASQTLAAQQHIRDFAFSALEFLGSVATGAEYVSRGFRTVGLALAANAASAEAFLTMNPKSAIAAIGAIRESLTKDLSDIWSGPTLGEKLRAAVGTAQRAQDAFNSGPKAEYDDPRLVREGKKKTIDFTIPETEKKARAARKSDEEKEADRQARAVASAEAQIRKFIVTQDAEAVSSEKLTAAEKLRVDVMEDLRAKAPKMSEESRRTIAALLDQADASETARRAEESRAKSAEESAKHIADMISNQLELVDRAKDNANSAEQQLRDFGKTPQELAAQAARAKRAEADSLKLDAAMFGGDNAADRAMSGILLEQAAAADRAAAAMEGLLDAQEQLRKDPVAGVERAFASYTREAESLGEAMERLTTKSIHGVEDALTSMVMGGKSGAKELVSTIISEFLRIQVIKPLLKDISDGLSSKSSGSSLWAAATSIFSSFLPGHASGLDYVPRDNYVARLHQGERVLTDRENRDYSAGRNKMQSIVFSPTVNVDARSDSAQNYAIVNSALRDSEARFMNRLKVMRVT